MPRIVLRLLPPLLLAFLVAACGPGGAFDDSKPATGCPVAGALEDAMELTRFRAESDKTPTDLDFAAQFARIGRTCYFDDSEAQIDIALGIEVRRGPANTTAEAPLNYFVAVLDPADNVVLRQPFRTLVKFQNRDTRVAFVEQFGVLIDLGKFRPSDFRVYVGFEMTPDELAYNRQRIGR